MNTTAEIETRMDVATDTAALASALAVGRRPDEALISRVRERAENARRELIAARGIQDIGVQLIREVRGDSNES
jgi:hypothetical protein